MSPITARLLDVIEVCQFAAPLLSIPTVLAVLILKDRPKPLRKSPGRTLTLLLTLCTALAFTTWMGSCVLGGLVEGRAICGFTLKGGRQLDPVQDAGALLVWYGQLFLFCGFFVLISLFGLLPGEATPWQRVVFVISLGRRGRWR
jgi:hypothetical protein